MGRTFSTTANPQTPAHSSMPKNPQKHPTGYRVATHRKAVPRKTNPILSFFSFCCVPFLISSWGHVRLPTLQDSEDSLAQLGITQRCRERACGQHWSPQTAKATFNLKL